MDANKDGVLSGDEMGRGKHGHGGGHEGHGPKA
jgi:hypothetical protein